MQLSDLYKNFGTSSPEEQAAFVAWYRIKRATDLLAPSTFKERKPSTSSAQKKLTLSDEEKALVKLLGLKQKDIIAMRELKASIEEVSADDSGLLNDSSFEEGDE